MRRLARYKKKSFIVHFIKSNFFNQYAQYPNLVAKKFKPKISYTMREIPIKYIKVWAQAQARKLDRDKIAELAKSIRHDGLLNPPMVQKSGKNQYLLMSGQRRLAAMKRLRAKTILVHVIMKKSELSLEEAKASSVVENIHRNDMTQKDIVAAATLLAEKMGKQAAARYLGITIATLYRYLGFAAVPDVLKELVPKTISRDDITKLYLAINNTKRAGNIAVKIQKLDPQLKKHYISMLSRNPKMSHLKLLRLARSSLIRQNISMKLAKTTARKLKVKADKNNLSPNDMAKKILERYIK